MRVCACMYTYLYVYIYACVYVCMYVCVCKCMYAYIWMYTDTLMPVKPDALHFIHTLCVKTLYDTFQDVKILHNTSIMIVVIAVGVLQDVVALKVSFPIQ